MPHPLPKAAQQKRSVAEKIRIHSSGNSASSSNGDSGEDWSLHPGAALRRKRGISAKEQQARAKHPVVLSQEIFEARALRKKAFHADKNCLIFCGEVREVLGWLHEARVFADCIVTSPPFYGKRDYGVAGQIGLDQKREEFVAKLVDCHRSGQNVLLVVESKCTTPEVGFGGVSCGVLRNTKNHSGLPLRPRQYLCPGVKYSG